MPDNKTGQDKSSLTTPELRVHAAKLSAKYLIGMNRLLILVCMDLGTVVENTTLHERPRRLYFEHHCKWRYSGVPVRDWGRGMALGTARVLAHKENLAPFSEEYISGYIYTAAGGCDAQPV